MYVGKDFDDMGAGENERFAFDFTKELATGDTIVSAEWIVTYRDTGAIATEARSGDVSISGARVSQRIHNLSPGKTYIMTVLATTTQGDILELWSRVDCMARI